MKKRQLPNIITASRLLATMAIIVLFFTKYSSQFIWIFVLFCYASLSDFIDGTLARHWKVVSPLGTVMDPMLDKVLTISMYMLLIPYHIVHPALLIALAAREIMVESIKNYQLSKGVITPSIWSGKLKMIAQVSMLSCMLLSLIYKAATPLLISANILAWIALFLAYYSGFIYLRTFLKIIKNG